ncbi:hypothetical protein ACIBL5_23055 [Streptomyces sp. NPDC050516]|uniref:hypothetical protein n=1 Tax=Streptomyces sp. NPDC050516 TaxID=3365621 RepID=UPI0037A315C1
MLYDSERARQPAAEGPDLTKQKAPQTTGPQPPRAPGEPFTGAANPARTRAAGSEQRLLPAGERDKLAVRLQQAVNNFVDSPRHAVEEADGAIDEMVTLLTNALTERQRTLRANWQSQDTQAETEELRVALQQYRETAERLLAI